MSEPAGYVEVRAYAELNDFLPAESRGAAVRRPFRAHQTVKDVLEAMGIPHTEVDLIVVNGSVHGFDHRPRAGDRIAAYPMFEALDIGPTARLRPVPLRDPRFVVDVNLGRLAWLLRLFGFDVWWSNDADDQTLAAIGAEQHRILLTRDRGLLKRRAVTHGLFVRPDDPEEQALGVIRRLDLTGRLAPLSRLRALQRDPDRGRQGRGERPAAAADPAVLRRLQPLHPMRPHLLARVTPREAARPGGKTATAAVAAKLTRPAISPFWR